MSSRYLDKPSEWKRLIEFIYADVGEHGISPIGLDSEFIGVDFDDGNNCVGRSVLDVWSIAVLNGKLHPRGYECATGYVLPARALTAFKSLLEDENVTKAAHNSTVDIHTFFNAGVDVMGVVDTLHLCRFAYPGKFRYGLDILSKEFLDESKFMSFDDLCSVPRIVTKQIQVKRCSCGENGCRKRKGHEKYFVTEDVDVESGTTTIPISDIGVDDSRWKDKVEYAGQDAVLALELYDYTVRKLKRLKYENPFV